MSAWPKLIWQITIDSTNQTFGWDETGIGAKTADITAGSYATILELLAELKTQMDAAGGITFTLTVSATGQVTITGDAAWTWTAATTDDGLEAILGLDGTESVASNILTPTDAHTHGWYPGVTSFGSASGASPSSDTDWTPEWPAAEAVAGSGALRRIAPSRARWVRTVGWDLLTDDECLDVDRGVQALARAWTVPIRWYPDRDIGTVASPGTQADPQDDPDDENADYWLVWLVEPPGWQLHAQSGAYRSVELVLHGEPD